MKQLSNSSKQIATLLIGFFTSAVAWAQDSISAIVDDFEIDTIVIDDGPYYAQLWFWVVIGIVFLLILVALLRGGRKRVEIKAEEKVEDKTQEQEKEIEKKSQETKVEEKSQKEKVEKKTQKKKTDKED